MKKHLILIIFISLCYSCKKPNITGHWHLRFLNKENYAEFYGAIDIEKNNDTYFTSTLSYPPVKAILDPKEKNIWIYYGACGSGNFDYYVKNGNTLYLENYLGAKLKAKKVTCNRIHDYQTALSLDFLIAKKTEKVSRINHHSLNKYINMGFSKKDSTIKLEVPTSYNNLCPINYIDSSLINEIESRHATEDIHI